MSKKTRPRLSIDQAKRLAYLARKRATGVPLTAAEQQFYARIYPPAAQAAAPATPLKQRVRSRVNMLASMLPPAKLDER
jgi:flagellum-specific peptidoglycan hydrolase FlgJ